MSLRLKALVIAVNVSLLIWGAVIYGGIALFNPTLPDVDPIATASVDGAVR